MTNPSNEPGNDGHPDNSSAPENIDDKGSALAASSQPNWVDGLTDDDKKVIGDKGFKTPADLLKSYREIEKLSGNKVSIPDGDDEKGMNKLFSRLGLPQDVDGYELSEVREIDETAVASFKESCLKSNILPKQAQALYDWYRQSQDKIDEDFTARSEKEREETFNSWGNDLSKNQELMRRGIGVLGLDETLMENVEMAIGTKKFMEMGLLLGKSISEDVAKGLSTSSAAKSEKMTPEEFYAQVLNQS